jgi:hypothetical protein
MLRSVLRGSYDKGEGINIRYKNNTEAHSVRRYMKLLTAI